MRIRRAVTVVPLLLAVATLAACGGDSSGDSGGSTGAASSRGGTDFKGERLVVANFGGADDVAFRKVLAEPFEKKYNAKITFVQGLSFDVLAKLKASKGNPSIDAWEMTDAATQTAVNQGFVEPMSASDVPSVGQLIPQAIGDGGKYVDYAFSGLTIVYNKDKVKNPPTSWKDLEDPAYKGKLILPNVNSGVFPNLVLALANANGGSASDIDPGFEALKRLKPNVLTFYSSMDQPGNLLTSGDALIGVWLSDRAVGAVKNGAPIGITYPSEGSSLIGNTLGISKGTKHLALARAFINYSLAAERNAALCSIMVLLPANKDAKLSGDLQQYVPSDEQLSKSVATDWAKVAGEIPDWTKRFQQEVLGS